MSINSTIISLLQDIAPVYPDICNDDTLTRYFTFNYDSFFENFSDNESWEEVYFLQIHFFCPLKENTINLCKLIKNRLKTLEGTVMSITNANDKEGQHWIFEMQAFEVS